VVLALQAGQLPDFVASYGALLGGKVVLDVTNPWRSDLDMLNIPRGSVDRTSIDTEGGCLWR
jgi:predicted dinucleotide-binding enzyme